MKGNRGFTLIELIMIISVLLIILCIPALKGNIILNYRERQELKELKNDINYARNKAIVESTKYIVDMRPYSNSYVIYKQEGIRKIVKRKELTDGIKINKTNIKGNEIIFTYSGAPEVAGTIELENRKGRKIEITITPATGKVNIYFY
ncbi:MAG: prepilin-type N-terminal cleavage/methylation domain-containing protein [Tissierellia bacterium]|nr:prepilin-type N-terminal cleavage/methylation domain-containing protein [Tissierellia bacterium]